MRVFASTDIGKSRPINEDAYYAPGEGETFCAVADGMGGHNAGEVASSIAVKEFSAHMRKAHTHFDQAIRTAVEKANTAIYAAAVGRDELSGMGTTITALCLRNHHAYIGHVGDSRAYLFRNNAIVRVTTDHTLVEEMVAKGLITVEEARVHPKRNYVTRALGTSPSVEVDVIRLDRRDDDIYLLCSDGLSNYVTEREMKEIVFADEPGDVRVARLIDRALQRGGSDNITAVLVTCEEDSGE